MKKLTTFLSLFILLIASSTVSTSLSAKGISSILESIQKLEGEKEPKCFATASRLENFMFGTPLTDAARFEKNKLQTLWVENIWLAASSIASKNQKTEVEKEHIVKAVSAGFIYKKNAENDWSLKINNEPLIIINKDDERQYGSIAYSLRAILATQQKQTQSTSRNFLPLATSAIDELKLTLDLFTLAALKLTDQQARLANEYELTRTNLVNIWSRLSGNLAEKSQDNEGKLATTERKPNKLKLLSSIIDQKVASYKVYNNISNQLFVRNLQVYFARNRWPEDPEVAKQFRGQFTETLISFAWDFYKGAEAIALSRGHDFIQEADVNDYAKKIVPHKINEYEDALFFPALDSNNNVEIESYDMDAFRDSGIHWRYLQFAIKDPKFKAFLEPDPFASELIVENIAQFGVLTLRMTGIIGKQLGDKRIKTSHFAQAIKEIQKRSAENNKLAKLNKNQENDKLSSVNNSSLKTSDESYFTDITKESELRLMHRTSDWLNRLLRSYLKKDKTTGIITIPPAFGGSGIAAEDINNDGMSDVLILSGLGNKLFLNQGNGKFKDITKDAGLDWKRKKDEMPGEVRQPLIADFNNDGHQDILITYVDDMHRVYKNKGDKTFEDVSSISQLGGENLVGGPATVFDFDNDGLLDIYITYFGDYLHGVLPTLKRRNSNGLPNKLFKNMGNFEFKDVTEGSNLDNSGWGQAVTHTDLDNDGLQDLIVGNDFGINAYYKNLGNGTFKNITSSIGTDKPSYTMNIGVADLNDDLYPDIYISNIVTMNKDEKYVLPNAKTEMKFNPEKLAHMRVVEANDLFLSKQSEKTGVKYKLSKVVDRGYSSTGWSWDADFFDFDNDGDEDLYVLNGMNEFNLYGSENPYYTDPLENKKVNIFIPSETKETNVFFVNDNGRFQNFSKESGMDFLGNSRSAAYLDFDLDGDLDVIVNNYHDSAVVYKNNAQDDNQWLKIKLIGDPSKKVNRDAIGAKIIVTTDSGRRIWREIHGSVGYMSVHPKVQHFGLGKSTSAKAEIIWPNGEIKRINNLEAKKLHEVHQTTQKIAQE